MNIDYSSLKFTFSKKPLLIGGKTMEYYDLRKAGNDIDFVVVKEDLVKLVKMYPNNLKDLWGDFGVVVDNFEIWKTIDYFNYDYLSEGSLEEENYLVISLEKLLLQRAMAMKKPKYFKDLELVVKKITDNQYSSFKEMKNENQQIISGLKKVSFIEKTGPDNNS